MAKYNHEFAFQIVRMLLKCGNQVFLVICPCVNDFVQCPVRILIIIFIKQVLHLVKKSFSFFFSDNITYIHFTFSFLFIKQIKVLRIYPIAFAVYVFNKNVVVSIFTNLYNTTFPAVCCDAIRSTTLCNYSIANFEFHFLFPPLSDQCAVASVKSFFIAIKLFLKLSVLELKHSLFRFKFVISHHGSIVIFS